ncbi:AEC family transporter [uncultured Ilyobacter sp.]|uniref:AEC family transporter n=1 Tax=uncultured Ilyobacter sp. TaxID=544433 RepID=UPI0029F5AB8D|nr:AEC family transporter [uncultured Ilyobacter sp.]
MFEILSLKIMPIVLFLFIGFVLKRFNFIKKEDGEVLLKIVFYIILPAVVFLSISQVEISLQLLFYPLSAVIMHLIMYALGNYLYKFLRLNSYEKNIFIGSLMILNMSFIFPFYTAFYGEKEIFRISLFDIGNILMMSSIVFYVFTFESNNNKSKFVNLLNIVKTPLIVSLIVGIIFNLFNIDTPISIKITLEQISKLMGPLIMIALGICFEPGLENARLGCIIIGVKLIFCLIIGSVLSKILSFNGIDRNILFLAGLAPIGNNILTFTLISGGDIKLATNLVSLSIVVSLVTVPFFMLFFA